MVGIISKVGEKGQIVIPKPIRDQFKITPNTELIFDTEDDKIVIEKKSDKEIVEEFVSAYKNKIKPAKNIDWDKLYYSQFG